MTSYEAPLLESEKFIFDDAALLRLLDDSSVGYTVDEKGFINLVADETGHYPEITVDAIYTEVNLHKLKSCGNFSTGKANRFTAHALENVHGDLNRGLNHTFDTPALKNVDGNLYAGLAKEFSAPALQNVGGDLYAGPAEEFSAPALQNVGGDLHAACAETFDTPSLQSVGRSLHVQSAEILDVTSLQNVGCDLDAGSVYTFFAPHLESVGGFLDAGLADTFSAPVLQTVNYYLKAGKAKVFSAPALKNSGNITLNPTLAGTQTKDHLFSGLIGQYHDISLFNRNSGDIKIDQKKWMDLDRATKIIQNIYRDNKHQTYREEYMTFFDECRKNMTGTIAKPASDNGLSSHTI